MYLPVAARLLGRMAAVAVRAQHAALLDFGEQIIPPAKGCDHGNFAELVSQVVEFEDHRVNFATQLAGVLAQVCVEV